MGRDGQGTRVLTWNCRNRRPLIRSPEAGAGCAAAGGGGGHPSDPTWAFIRDTNLYPK